MHKAIHPFVGIQDGIGGMTAGLGAVWVVDGKEPVLLRVDPRYQTIQRIRLPANKQDIDFTAPTEVVTGAGSVWVAEANTVFRINPTTLRVVKAIDVPQADLLAFGDGALWVGSSNTSSISKIDPAIDGVVTTVKLRHWVNALAVAGGFVWATVIPDDTLWKIDGRGAVDKTLEIGHGAGDVQSFDGAIWVATIGAVRRVDPETDAITSYPVGDRLVDLASGNGVLYVTTGDSPPKLSSLPGDQIAHISMSENFLDDSDPAHAYPAPQFRPQLAYATGAGLLRYPDAPAPRGSTLEPDVAAAMPAVSDGGRTYTFRIRPGFRFSPPSNQPVTAETFRYSIERALSPGLGAEAPAYSFLSDVVGAGAFHAGKTPHVVGISVQGDKLRIRLVAPHGAFLARLSMPFFTAVPIGTPIVNGGVQTPIPSAGPYYVKTDWEGELKVLERNPNYHGPRPHRLQRVVYDIGDGTRRTIDRIQSRDADYAADALGDPAFASGGPLDTRYGRSHSPGRPELVQTPQLAVRFVQFNTRRGPFADARLRRAVNFAIDRTALAAVQGDRPSDSYLPPGLASTDHTRSYPLHPDLSRARSLLHGFRGTVVLWACTDPDCTTTARIVRANLQPLGVKVRIRQLDNPFGAALNPRASYDILLSAWFLDWPDPSDFLNLYLDPNGYRPDWAPPPLTIPEAYRRQLEHAALLRGDARVQAYRRLTRKLEQQVAPFAVYSVPVLAELYSGRVTCRVEQPVLGVVDLGTLCVKKS